MVEGLPALNLAFDVTPSELVSAIVTEAGGRMTDLEGRPSWSGPTVLATNGILHEEMLSLLGG